MGVVPGALLIIFVYILSFVTMDVLSRCHTPICMFSTMTVYHTCCICLLLKIQHFALPEENYCHLCRQDLRDRCLHVSSVTN